MKAVVLQAGNRFALEDIPKPELKSTGDALVRVTTAAICGSDVHAKHGLIPGYTPGTVMGHEFVGVVEETGDDVLEFKPGDRVAAAPITWCGVCRPCKRGEPQHCIRGGVWGGGEIFGRGLRGAQTDYIQVPFADNCLIPIPDNVEDIQAVFVGDVFATGYSGAHRGYIQTGDTVVVYGCGPIGLGAIISAWQFGPRQVFAVDMLENRLALARLYGATTIDAKSENVVEKVRQATGGEGVDVAIEAIGSPDAFMQALRSVRRGGSVSVVGLFPGPIEFPLHEMGFYGVRISMGLGDPSCMSQLMGLLESGRVDLGAMATHTFCLDDALEAYDLFENQKGKCLKVLIKP
ncbi:MAG: alcohol dehydrogenase catalytic domain-containing protein [Syntrophorhabdaceae bacterium]|nr:alcohol dehydrogenase catalytic domain-containing protein [Syntrophorhabdaceae bacterium]MDD5242499.1 alcohol dehydrogenase catalytic domain-containing protein [Syntrophorhabdaceae bacterium]